MSLKPRIKVEKKRPTKREDMRRRKRKLRCPVCLERLTYDKLFDMYDCPNGHAGDFRHGFAYEETLSDDYKPVY